MNIFKRLFKIGQAETNSVIDKLEDPIKMTEQGIKDMKLDLSKSLEALAQVKAMSIRANDEMNSHQNRAKEYENKAMILLQKAQKGEIEMAKAESLAKESLIRKEEEIQLAATAKKNYDTFSASTQNIQGKVNQMKTNLSKFENELKTLKARVKVSNATKNLNKQLANIDNSSTINMLERMKDKVVEEEALADAYGDMANESKSLDEEIDKLVDGKESAAMSELDQLKAKLGLDKDKNENN